MADAHIQFAGQIHLAKTIELCAAMLAIDTEAAALCEGLTEEQLSSSLHPGSWSIAQNLAHLRTTTGVFLPTVDFALEQSRKLKLLSRGRFGLSPYGRLLVWQMNARPVFKLQAPPAIRPQLLPSPGLELEHFLISQSAMRKRIQDAEGLSLTALRFSSPLAKYVRMNLLECFCVLNAHSRRHLRQANNVRRTLFGPTYKTLQGRR
jgi:hypothetical protein